MKDFLVIMVCILLIIGCKSNNPQDDKLVYPVNVEDMDKKTNNEVNKKVSSAEKEKEEVIKYEEKAEDVKYEEKAEEELKNIENKATKKKETKKDIENQVKEITKDNLEENKNKKEEIVMNAKEEEIKRKEEEIKRKEEELKKKQEELKKKEKEKLEKAEKKGKGIYLRIISLEKHEYFRKRVNDIEKFLTDQGIKAKARASGNFWVVDISGFKSYSSPEAKDFQKRIQNMRFKGNYDFKDAYFLTY